MLINFDSTFAWFRFVLVNCNREFCNLLHDYGMMCQMNGTVLRLKCLEMDY